MVTSCDNHMIAWSSLSVWGKDNRLYELAGGQLKSQAALPGQTIPYGNNVRSLRARYALTVRTECKPFDMLHVALEDIDAVSGACIPQPHGLIITPTRNHMPIWAERDGLDTTGMSVIDTKGVSTVQIPQPHGVTITPTHQHTFLTVQCEGTNAMCMATQDHMKVLC
jgi:hypothetical protein